MMRNRMRMFDRIDRGLAVLDLRGHPGVPNVACAAVDAAPAIPLHAFAALTAFVLGVVQFAAPKGTLPHRRIGWIWVGLMAAVAVSSFWIHQIRLVGPVEPDPSAVDLHAAGASARRVEARTAPRRRPSPHHVLHFLRGACGRRAVHAAARADHARSRIWPLGAGKAAARRFRALERGSRTLFEGRFRACRAVRQAS